MSDDTSNNNKFIFIAIAVVFVGIAGYLAGTMSRGGGDSSTGSSYISKQGGTGTSGTGTAGVPREFGAPQSDTALIDSLKAKLASDPTDLATHVRLGKAYFSMMQFDKSVEYFGEAIKLNPSLVDTYNDMALANHYLGNSAKALVYVEEGIERNPYFQRIWLTKGFILAYGMGDQDGALKSFEKTISISPETPIADAAREYLTEFNKGN